MNICQVCGNSEGKRIISQIPMCEDCFGKLQKLRNEDPEMIKFFLDDSAYIGLSTSAKEYFKRIANEIVYKENYQEIREQEIQKEKEIEIQKQEYAMSLDEQYEYEIETVINEDHGRIDKEHMLSVLSRRASQGWKLHTIYSNELGKNAVKILGFGINSTACEDVMIFERRISKIK